MSPNGNSLGDSGYLDRVRKRRFGRRNKTFPRQERENTLCLFRLLVSNCFCALTTHLRLTNKQPKFGELAQVILTLKSRAICTSKQSTMNSNPR